MSFKLSGIYPKESRTGTYFSLLPNELIDLIYYYYVFPIQLVINNRIFTRDTLQLIISRKNGPQSLDEITAYMNVTEFLNELNTTGAYRDEEVLASINHNKLTIKMTVLPWVLSIIYNQYETEVFLRKLRFILTQIEEYIRQGLSDTVIISKIRYYIF